MATARALIVMPRYRSRSMSSSVCSRISRLSTVPVFSSNRSAKRALAVIDVGNDREVADVFAVELRQREPSLSDP